MLKRRDLIQAAVASGVVLPWADARAQTAAWPNKPVKLIVPNLPGGSTDNLVRLFQPRLEKIWGQSIVVEYKPGAGTVLGTDFVAKSAPDGYTLGAVVTSHVINPHVRSSMPFDTLKDLAHICMTASSSLLLMASPKFGPSTFKEVVDYIKANPGKVSYASPGAGSSMHLAGEMLKQRLGLFMLHIPYRGSSGAYPDVYDGRVELMIDPTPSGLQQVSGGRMKPIVVFSAKRDPLAPNIPAIGEFVKDFDVLSVNGLVAPAKTPRDIVNKISTDVQKLMQTEEFKTRLNAMGLSPIESNPAHFEKFVSTELKRWEPVIKYANIPKE